ncbi:hypothetical protein [Faecalibacter rhinopitheci]|uniref:Uncharacterized protein n=1 Tax=Faecalibacter rhinopitheci TaxID=2779678 RepID=A0A8J7FP99_9FLAO|nr:hypothetical protein [Faecalibacter rhinopitheci]MBF0596829.1 hypothetical protein [Faecalibacter rhinopitheci]
MKNHLFLLCAVLPILSFSQVGINTIKPNASLDVQANATTVNIPDGIIAPRLTGEQLKAKDSAYNRDQIGAMVYVTQGLVENDRVGKTIKVKNPGYYYFDGEIWQIIEIGKQAQDWFYMPSFNLDMGTIGQKTVNLYESYRSQFVNDSSNSTRFFSSNSTTTYVSNSEQTIFEANELEYIVTYYNDSYLTINSISADGMMTYTVKNTNPPANSFINIILKPLK